MKNISIVLFCVFCLLLSVSCSKDSENVEDFKQVKLIFKEKKDQVLLFKNKAKAIPTKDEEKYFHDEFKTSIQENDKYAKDSYIIFDSKNSLRLLVDDKEKTFKYKFEGGFLKLLHKDKSYLYAVGSDVNQLKTIVTGHLISEINSNGSSVGSGSTGELKEYMLLPLSFEGYKKYHQKTLEEITGDKKLFLYRAEYIYKVE